MSPNDVADLAILDLAAADTPDGRARLARELRDGFRTNGFVYAINHGYSQPQRDRIFDVARVPFEDVPLEEKKAYTADTKQLGYYAGYKPRRYWKVDSENGVWDQIEHYSVDRNVHRRPHPRALRPFLPEIDAFARHNHLGVLHLILRLLALSLELPEETLVDKHTFNGQSESAIRFMKYYRRTEEEERLSKNVWLKGHTDIGSITILWSQPIGGLQILSHDGVWRSVRHIDNALVINTGDMIQFLSGGFYKPTIHRVVQPPPHQRNCDRLGVFYFAMADDDVPLVPLVDSPVLQRVGIERHCPDDEAPLAGQWRRDRSMSYGNVPLKKNAQSNTEEEVIGGIVVKHYN